MHLLSGLRAFVPPLLTLLVLSASAVTQAQPAPQPLPAEVSAALARAKVPQDAVTVLVVDAEGQQAPRLSHRAQVPFNPASVMKLVTTYAALDLLGPAYTWRTPVWVDGTVQGTTLRGNLYLQGRGDPKLVAERLWLLLRRVQGLGISTIAGDIVLDRSAFATQSTDPANFDGEPLRPYNATPDALLVNYKSVVMTLVPDPTAQLARVHFEPPLAGVQMQANVPLSAGPCNDYRATLKADLTDPSRIRFLGSYPASCGEKVWPLAYADPATYAARAVAGLWHEMGGQLTGTVREGRAPTTPATFEMTSPTLLEVVRDINKYSNNVMAQQLFLTLSLPASRGASPSASATSTQVLTTPGASFAASREVLRQWWQQRISPVDAPVLDNGSGLSRVERISAQALARLLQTAYGSPLMPELMSALPIAGVDGTLKRSKSQAPGRAHLKTGSLRDVTAVAGYVHGASGHRYVLVAMVNHPNASAARPAFDALLDWTVDDN